MTSHKQKRKLLIVTTSTKTFNFILKDQISFLNQYFRVYVGSNNPHLIKEYAQKQNVEYFVIPMYRKINILADIKSIFTLILILRKLKPHIIHSFTPKAGLVCAISGFLCRVPARVNTFTGLIFPYKRGILKWILSCIDYLICLLNTHTVAEGKGVKDLLYKHNIIRKKVHIIGNGNIAGVDTNYFNPMHFRKNNNISQLKIKYGVDESVTTFIFVGRINEEKGIIELLQAIKNLKSKEVNLIILGSFETSEFEIKVNNMIKLGLKNVHIVNWKEDIRPYLYISDCFVLPSYREGFPNVLLQAGAMGLPSIVTNVPGSNEIISNNFNGWICDSKNIEELGELLKNVTSIARTELKEKGLKAMKNIKRKYEKATYQKLLVQFYNQLKIN